MTKPLLGVRADSKRSYRDVEKTATHVRGCLALAPGQPIDALSLFENLHLIRLRRSTGEAIPLGYGVVTLEDSEGYSLYDKKRNVMEILASERAYRWLEERHPRGTYFVTHELGHCVLHTDQLMRLAQMPTEQQAAFHRGRIAHKPYEDTEWQANAFASALLMPARGLEMMERRYGALSVSKVADQFGVSTEAAGYRLGLYTSRRKDLLL
jgi:hypothetical protein